MILKQIANIVINNSNYTYRANASNNKITKTI